MKICYVDESGNQESDPCLVMVGILVDAARLNRTQREFGEAFDAVQRLFDEPLQELKGAKIVPGKARWRNVRIETRKHIAEYFCKWIQKRKHTLLLAAIDRKRFNQEPMDEWFPKCPIPLWLAAGFHIALQVQKTNQAHSKNKGHTFLVFDENKMGADYLSDLLWQPPPWSDSYYSRGKKQEALDQVIDTAFTIKSHHAGLVQVADLFAYLLRRYAELCHYGLDEEWAGERAFITSCAQNIGTRLAPRANRWASKSNSECAKWYASLVPDPLKRL